jgi:hypothetical protein
MPWCGSRWVDPSVTVCPGGGKPTANMNGAPEEKPTTPGTTPGGSQSTGRPSLGIPPQADTSRVLFGREPGRPALGPGAGTVPVSMSVYDITRRDSKGWLTNLKANDPGSYQNLIGLLRSGGFLGPRANSSESIRRAVDEAAKEASARYSSGQTENVDFLDYLFSRSGSGDMTGAGGSRGRSGRAAAYDGPVESVQVAAETDIIAAAQATAQELLGRAPTQAELDKILKRTRKAEQTQPTVQTRQGPGRVTTEEGLTKEGRDAILKQVLMSSPDYAGYQIDSTMMDMFSNILSRGQAVARG